MAENKKNNKSPLDFIDNLLGSDPSSAPSSKEKNDSGSVGLIQSENLKIAQKRILELDEEIERLRRENEQLIAAGQTLQRRVDELTSATENLSRRLNDEKSSFEDERRLLTDAQQAKDRENARLRTKVEELEIRLSTDLKKIRVRERELENRLEIMKVESAALVRNKDEMILEMKRRVDQLTLEAEHHRSRESHMNEQIQNDQEKIRRVVKAMRLAMSLLEDEDSAVTPLKKVK